MNRLLNALAWFLVAAMFYFHKEVHQFFLANPKALWAALAAMLVFAFRQAYLRELKKQKSQDCS